MLNILYTVLTSLFGSMSTCFVLDNIFKKVIKPNAQYFILHVCLNSYIVYITRQETLDFFLSPTIDVSEYTENSVKSASVCIGFHMYHYLTNELDFETKVHHIVTVFITGSTSLLIPSGRTTAACNFICVVYQVESIMLYWCYINTISLILLLKNRLTDG